MPTVPRLQQPQVKETGYSAPRVSVDAPIEAFGGGASMDKVNSAAMGLAGQADKIFQEEKKKADELVVTDAYAQLVKVKNRLTYDPKDGAMTRQGRDAFGVVDEFGAKYDAEADTIEQTLKTDDQRKAFQKIRFNQRMDFDGSLQKHLYSESERYDNETTKAGLEAAREDAIMNYQDPERLQASLKIQRDIVMQHAARKGAGPEQAQALLAEAEGDTHAQIMTRMLANGQDLEAKAYFDANKDKFHKNITRVEAALEEGSIRGESQRKADEIMGMGLPLAQAIAQAKKVEDPKLRDALVDRVKQDFSLKEASKRDFEESMYLKATNIIEKGGKYTDIPPHEVAQMPLSMRTSLQRYASDKASGSEVEPNGENYYRLKQFASDPANRDQFLKMNLLVEKGKMRDSEVKELYDIQADLRKGGSKGAAQLDGIRTDMQIVNDGLIAVGMDPSPKPGTDEAKKVVRFRGMVDQEVKQLSERTGKKPTGEEVQNIVDKLMIKGIKPGSGFLGFFKDEKHAFEAESGEELEIDVNSIPAKDRAEIAEALGRRKKPITDAAIIRMYSLSLRTNRGN